jgi:hypothetical protein
MSTPNEWYVQHGGKQYGPMSGANLKKLAAEGKITPATTVRRGAEGNWVPASRVQGLFAASTSASAPPAAKAAPPRAAKPPGAAKVVAPVAPISSDPDFDDLGPLTAPPIEPPAPPPRANPLGTPVAPLATRGRVPKAVPAETSSVAPKIVGGVAVILAAVAVTTCWLPIMGGFVGWTGIVAGAMGLLIGGAGLALAAKHKGSGLMLNVFGGAGAAVGLVLSIVLGVAFGMFTSKAPQPVVAAKPVQATPTPIQVPEPEPEPEIKWTDASEPIQQEAIKAQVMSVGIEQVALESNDPSILRKQKPQPMLKIKVAVENTTTEKIVQFTGWIGGGDAIGQGVGKLLEGSELGKAVQSATPTAKLTDNVGNPYQQVTTMSVFGAQLPTGQDNALRPAQNRQAEMVFPPPLPSIEFLHLELSPAAYGGSEPLRWEIPKGMITGFAAPASP